MPDRDRDHQGRPRFAGPRDRYGRPRPHGAGHRLGGQDPEGSGRSIPDAFTTAVEMFDRRRFFEAHEWFEHIWRSDAVDDADRDFWKGVTQVAVGCCHVQRGNVKGARAVLERAAGYLKRYPAVHRNVDTRALADSARAVARALRAGTRPEDVEFPLFPR